MVNDTPISFYRVLQLIIDVKIPVEVIKEIETWNFIIKSPYSHSYYNAPVGWKYKTPNSLRISDHWNFSSNGKKHCQTTNQIEENCWGIGQFDAELNKYTILKAFPTPKKSLAQNCEYLITRIQYERERAFNHLREEKKDKYIPSCDLRFLLRYFKTLEKFS